MKELREYKVLYHRQVQLIQKSMYSILGLLSPKKTLLMFSMIQEWLDTRNETLVACYLHLCVAALDALTPASVQQAPAGLAGS